MHKVIFKSIVGLACAFTLVAPIANAEYCAAISPHLGNIEKAKHGPKAQFHIGLDESFCQYSAKTSDIFKNRFECVWENSDEHTWTQTDAREIGARLNSNCSSLTTHFGASKQGESYFLWYGNYTTVLIFVTETGLKLTAQIDEEAYHWS